jgi:hypothetical protein
MTVLSEEVDRWVPLLPALSRRFIYAIVLTGLVGCVSPADDADGNSGALADTLTTLIADAYDFDRPGVLDRMIALYANSDEIVSASGGQITVSADSVGAGIVRFWELAGQNMRDARWSWEDVHVERLGADAAVLTGSWSIPHIAPDGQPHLLQGAWTAAFRKLDGEWKIVHEHLSAPAAAVEGTEEPR